MNTELIDLRLTSFFTQQLSAEEIEHALYARVPEVQRSHIIVGDGVDEWRLGDYKKLVCEESRNTASIAEQRHRNRQFGKTIKAHLELQRQRESAR